MGSDAAPVKGANHEVEPGQSPAKVGPCVIPAAETSRSLGHRHGELLDVFLAQHQEFCAHGGLLAQKSADALHDLALRPLVVVKRGLHEGIVVVGPLGPLGQGLHISLLKLLGQEVLHMLGLLFLRRGCRLQGFRLAEAALAVPPAEQLLPDPPF